MRPDRMYWIGPVEITRHHVDWADLDPDFNDLARLSLNRLDSILLNAVGDHHYLNPAFSLKAAAEVPEQVFLRQANRACILWNKQIARVLSNGIRKRAAKRVPDNVRMLAFSGVLLLHGRLAHTKRLNDANLAK